MKQIYLIHGWGGSSEGGWFDWLKQELKGKVTAFDMPDTNYPKIENWVGFLNKNIKKIDKETYFIGHSIGCQTILRYIEGIDKKIKGAVFVAGWFNLKQEAFESEEDRKIAKPWIETKIDFYKIKKNCGKFLAIFSDNDPYVPLSDVDLFKKRLNAKIIIKHNMEHFNNVQKINEILEFVGK